MLTRHSIPGWQPGILYRVENIENGMNVLIHTAKPSGIELCALFDAVGWVGNDPLTLEASIAAYPCTLTARAADGTLIGYLSAFSDNVLTTMIGELVVHAQYQRIGVGSALLRYLRDEFARTSVYAAVLPEAIEFFRANGFAEPSVGMAVMVARRSQLPSTPNVGTSRSPTR